MINKNKFIVYSYLKSIKNLIYLYNILYIYYIINYKIKIKLEVLAQRSIS